MSLFRPALKRRGYQATVLFFVLRDDFTEDSDVDVLVEFLPGKTPGLAIVTLADELSNILGRVVDLRTSGDLSRYFRDRVLQESVPIYER